MKIDEFQLQNLRKIKKKLLLYSSALLLGANIASHQERKEYDENKNKKILVKEIKNGRKERFDLTCDGSRNGE